MKLNKIPKSELELLSYTEIAKIYLEETKKTMTTADLFKEVYSRFFSKSNNFQRVYLTRRWKVGLKI